jgi:hypothetical protein
MKDLTGQYKWTPETGETNVVGSKDSERVKPIQQSLLDWGDDQGRLAAWNKAAGEESDGDDKE